MEGDHARKPLLQGKYNDYAPRISPDGRWMAYTSDESGIAEVYVRPFPDVNEGKWKVSTAGGDSPLWSRDSRELFYHGGGTAMAVRMESAPAFKAEKPTALFRRIYFGQPLTCISHQLSAAASHPGMSTALRSVGFLNVLSSTPAESSRRAPCINAPLHRLATKPGEKCRLTLWDISSDGKRFLIVKEAVATGKPAEVPRKINIVLN